MKDALVRTAHDEAQVHGSERVTKTREDDARDTLLSVLSTETGRRFVHWVLVHCGFTDLGVFQLSYLGNAEEALVAEGRRQVGQQILGSILSNAPQTFQTMLLEAAKYRKEIRR